MNIEHLLALFFFGVVVGGLAHAIGYNKGLREGTRLGKGRDQVVTKVIRDMQQAPRGSVLVLMYPGFFTKEQRAAIESKAKEKVGDNVNVLVLEGGITATFR